MMKINLERVMNLLHIEEKVRVQPRLKKIHDAVVRELEQHADGTAPEAAEVPDLPKPVPPDPLFVQQQSTKPTEGESYDQGYPSRLRPRLPCQSEAPCDSWWSDASA